MTHTPCKECVFAKYVDNTQTDCLQGNLDKYKKIDVSIAEVYDEDKEFFVIEGVKCVSYREVPWLDFSYSDEADRQQQATTKLKEEQRIHYTALVYVAADQTFEDAKPTILSVFNSSILPANILIIYQDNIKQISTKTGLPDYSSDIAWCQQNCRGIKFRTEYLSQSKDLHFVLSFAASKCKNSYLLLEAGKKLRPDIIQQVNDQITQNLHSVVAARHADNSYHEFFAFKSFHDYVGGFGKKTVHEKIDSIIADAKDKEKCLRTFLTYN